MIGTFNGIDDGCCISLEQFVETAAAHQCVHEILRSCRSQSDTHVIQVVDVCHQVLLGEVVRYVRKVINQCFPVNAS